MHIVQMKDFAHDDWEIAELEKLGVSHVWYHYENGEYDGSGMAAVRFLDGRWMIHDMGHCSCNGAWELPSEGAKRDTLAEAVAAFKVDYWYRGPFDAVTLAAKAWHDAESPDAP